MTLLVCALTLIVSCHSRAAAVLNVNHAAAGFADVYYTQRRYSVCKLDVRCRDVEANALTRPFQSNGKAVAYTSSYGGLTLASLAAGKMRTSHNRVLRRIWWLPQGVLMGASIYGAYSQARDYGPALAKCGAACVTR